MSEFLVDTNILVYAYDRSEMAKKSRARDILGWLESNNAGLLSTQILGEFFNVVTRKLAQRLSPAEGYRSVQRYLSSWPVVPVTPSTVLEATRGSVQHAMSYWDAQVWATARMNQIPTVLSEDIQYQGIIEGVRFLNPLVGDFLPKE